METRSPDKKNPPIKVDPNPPPQPRPNPRPKRDSATGTIVLQGCITYNHTGPNGRLKAKGVECDIDGHYHP